MPFNLKDKKVTVIGAARSGIAVANVVLRLGGIAKISEGKKLEEFSAQLEELDSRFRGNDNFFVEAGGHTEAFIQDSDYVVLSPGVRLDAVPVKWAGEKGIE